MSLSSHHAMFHTLLVSLLLGATSTSGQLGVESNTTTLPSLTTTTTTSSSDSSTIITHSILPSLQPTKKGPRVDAQHSGNVSIVLGRRASLRCRVVDRSNYTVSWIRHRDLHLLTVEQYTYTSDQRFKAMYEPSTGDWVLLVEWVQERDAGVYECQIGTTPPRSHFVTLHVVEPRTEILGGGDLYINMGSTINLTCLVLYHARSPDALVWLHEGKEIHYDSARGGVSVVTEAGEVTRSALLIQRATSADSGNYTCQPKDADPAYVSVHVIRGEYQAVVQGGGSSCTVGGGTLVRYLTLLSCAVMLWDWLRFRVTPMDMIWLSVSSLTVVFMWVMTTHVLFTVVTPFLTGPMRLGIFS